MDFKAIIQEIESDENKRRKAEHQKRQHVFNDHLRPYVLSMLTKEFSQQTVSEMRTCTSINLSKRIITEMASIYKRAPERTHANVSEQQHEGIEAIYEAARANVKLKRSNQKYKLHDQCAIQVIPQDGVIAMKLLAPHQYDVVPDPTDPERAIAYIISAYDKTNLDNETTGVTDIQGNYYGSKNDQTVTVQNKSIADKNDYQSAMNRYVIWTAEQNLVVNSQGQVLEANPNPIGMLPFIDVANEKDFEFWVRRGSGVVEFSLDFSVVLSDTCNTNRLQSYAQPVIVAERIPESVTVGPQHILFLPLDPSRPEIRPSFEFASPNPDLNASLSLQDRLVSYFLTSQGIDPKTIASSGEGNKFTSGLERLLAMIEKFEASQDDIDLYRYVEEKLYTLFRAWYQVTVGTNMLKPELNFGVWPDNATQTVKFSGPEMIRTEADKEDSVIKLLGSKLISKKEAIMELRGVEREKAEEIIEEIEDEGMLPTLTVKPEAEEGAPVVEQTEAIAEDVRKETLNGAQITSVIELIQGVASKTIPRDSALNILEVAFNLDTATANSMLGSAGKGFKIETIDQQQQPEA
jgi:hypothetical protein